jgi:uncharacterized repeat protein (TIGR03847 family)
VGSIGVGYDEAADRVVLVIEEASEEAEGQTAEPDQEEQEEPAEGEVPPEHVAEDEPAEGNRASGRVHLTRSQVAAFVERARGLVEAGRPTCRFCGRPMNPGGHRCARTNGHGSD